MNKRDWFLALHFPAVNDPNSPAWLEQFIEQHPNTGVLSVRYSHFGKHLYGGQRPQDMDTTTWLITILSQQNDCLSWIYHPGEVQVLQKWQVEANKWLAEQLERERLEAELLEQRREHERQEIKKREQNRLAREEERQRHIEIVQLRERQLQERSQQIQVADRKGEPSLSPSLVSKS